jgi:antibiotic biosynthesis monooxygenase (ABM) superfamily enzyme
MQFPDHVLTVRATVEAGREAEFNRWYDHEHVPDAVRMLGAVAAARYKVVLGDGSHQYMAMYAFETAEKLEAAVDGPEIKNLIRRYDEAIGAFSRRQRTTYTKVLEYRMEA